MTSYLLEYAVSGTSLQPPMSEREVIEAVTSSYPQWAKQLLVTSHIETIQDALNVLNRLEAIDGHHDTSQEGPSQNTRQTRNNYHREDHRDGRTHAVRQTYIDRERRNVRNSRYPVQQLALKMDGAKAPCLYPATRNQCFHDEAPASRRARR